MPLEILHRAAPRRNVPVTFTLDRWMCMADISIVVDPASLKREPNGNVTGMLLLRGEAADFPAAAWFDFPVVVLGWWIAGLTKLSSGETRTFQGLFMDGPYAFTVRTGHGDEAQVAWGPRGKELLVGVTPIQNLLASAVRAGTVVAEACRAQDWRNSDIDQLEHALARAAV